MNVLHLATFDAHGGAAVAVLRLIESQQRRGDRARLLVREKTTALDYVDAVTDRQAASPGTQDAAHLAWLFTKRARAGNSGMAFSSDTAAWDVADHPAVAAADVLHLHWVAGFLSASAIRRLQQLGKPVVWTLHDQFPFTGGCHYTQHCAGFRRTCRRCPELQPAAQALASLSLAEKRASIDPARLMLAAPSKWIAARARESALFRTARITVVPYGIDVAARRVISPEAARKALNIPDGAFVIFASSLDHREPRKGAAHLVGALEMMQAARAKARPGRDRRVLVLRAGEGAGASDVGGFTAWTLGALAADDPRLAMAYRAADAFVLPSLEDNLPNTLLEAMAAGVPVVAYRTGGVPDLIQDQVNGRLIRRGDIAALAQALLGLMRDDGARRALGAQAAATALAQLDWPIQAEAYERIYEQARPRATRRRAATRGTAVVGAGKVGALLADRTAVRLFTALLKEEAAELQDVIASRGGEIRDLHAAVAAREREGHQALAERDAAHTRETAALKDAIAAGGREVADLKKAVAEAQQAGARRKEVLNHLLRVRAADARRPRVGIFGAGESGRRIFEAAILLNCVVAWFADNDPGLQGPLELGCEVIAPAIIPRAPVDAVIIGSARRAEIHDQLVTLGIARAAIVSPDLSRPDAELLDELRRTLAARRG